MKRLQLGLYFQKVSNYKHIPLIHPLHAQHHGCKGGSKNCVPSPSPFPNSWIHHWVNSPAKWLHNSLVHGNWITHLLTLVVHAINFVLWSFPSWCRTQKRDPVDIVIIRLHVTLRGRIVKWWASFPLGSNVGADIKRNHLNYFSALNRLVTT